MLLGVEGKDLFHPLIPRGLRMAVLPGKVAPVGQSAVVLLLVFTVKRFIRIQEAHLAVVDAIASIIGDLEFHSGIRGDQLAVNLCRVWW